MVTLIIVMYLWWSITKTYKDAGNEKADWFYKDAENFKKNKKE